jgi:hypothetical protein
MTRTKKSPARDEVPSVLEESKFEDAGESSSLGDNEVQITEESPKPKKRASKATVKKASKKTVEKIRVSFEDPYVDSEDYESGRLQDSLRKNITRILEEKTDLELRVVKGVPGISFELQKKDLSTTPLDPDYITTLVYKHLPAYTENQERLSRMRSCEIRELDGKFLLFVLSNQSEYGYCDTDEIVEMSFNAGDYVPIEFS